MLLSTPLRETELIIIVTASLMKLLNNVTLNIEMLNQKLLRII